MTEDARTPAQRRAELQSSHCSPLHETMSSCSSRSYSEFERRLFKAKSDSAFKARFAELSRSGDRSGMISGLLEKIEASEALPIGDFYRGKDEAEAEKLLRRSDSEEDSETRAALCTEALRRAPSQSALFYEALASRARCWLLGGQLVRCLKDCRSVASSSRAPEERRIEALLMLADCCKAAGQTAEAKYHLNEAMHAISDMALRQCDGGERTESFSSKKAELLKGFLERRPRMEATSAPVDALQQKELKVPELEGSPNDFLSCCSDAVSLGSDESRGRYLYATRDIKPGSVLIVDRPFASSTDFAALGRNCLRCHASLRLETNVALPCETCQAVQFCSEECRQHAWIEFHKYECRIFNYFYEKKVQRTSALLAYRTVVTAALRVQDEVVEINSEFAELHSIDKKALDIKSLKTYESQDYKTVFSLKTHCSHFELEDNFERAIQCIFFAKCLIYSLNFFHPEIDNYERHLHILAVALLHSMQAINCNAYEIVENVRDDETKILEPRNVGGAIYTSVSLTNHSCYPNIVRHSFPCGTVVVKSIRYIPQGAEILDCYGQHFLENKRESRRKLLAQKYYFECQCEACSLDWPIKLPNDQFNFKCKKCSKQCRRTRNAAECIACGQKTEISKLYALLQNSIKKRLTALTKMYDDHYQEALPLLLEHASCIDKILSEPSLEAVKTQQSIIQCLNAMSSTSI